MKRKEFRPTPAVTPEQRRHFLRLFGTATALLPITLVTGCGNDSPSAPPDAAPPRESDSASPQGATPEPAQMTEPEPTPEPAMPASEPEPQEPQEPMGEAAPGEMTPVDPNVPTALALGYQHNAADVDATRYPDRNPAHNCSNCILYQGAQGDEWGGYPLFPGKTVNANGWCSSYTPKPT